MRVRELHDYGRDPIDTWLSRLRRFRRVAGFVLDLFHSLFFVALPALIAAMIGGLIGATWGESGFLLGAIAGGVLGSMAGIAWAKHVFFSGTKPAAGPDAAGEVPGQPGPGAYRWPGVAEEFARRRKRGMALFLPMGAALLVLHYRHRPVPSSLAPWALEWALVGFMVVLAVLMAWSARCPKCRRFLRQAAKLHQCPHCGVVLRDPFL